MSDSVTMQPGGSAVGSIRPPGSKSLTNRALVCAALAKGTSRLSGVLDSEDTRVMLEGLSQLGIAVAHDPGQATAEVKGTAGVLPCDQADLFVANSGTTIRFLTAMLGGCQGTFRLHGIPRMHERPIEDLLAALRQLGVEAHAESAGGCPPVSLKTSGFQQPTVLVRGDISSQYLSGLLMAAPLSHGPLTLRLEGPLVSRPYVEMTLAVMRSFGVEVQADWDAGEFVTSGESNYVACDYAIEPDASAASYFWAAAAITGGRVTVEGLGAESLQGDVGFVNVLEKMGCRVEWTREGVTVEGGPLHGVDIDMNEISDTVQTLSAVALFAEGATRIRGVGHNRHKETDRIGDLACELRKVGAAVSEHDDGLTIHPQPLSGARLATYNDHRMAMSLALIGLRQEGIVIENPGCTVKTYPDYFTDLARLFQQPILVPHTSPTA